MFQCRVPRGRLGVLAFVVIFAGPIVHPTSRQNTYLKAGSLVVLSLVFSSASRRLDTQHPPETKALAAAPTDLVLEDVTIIDGNGTAGVPHRDLLIANGRIKAIAAHAPRAWPGTPRLDVAGRFVVPGYIDMHEHIAGERWAMSPTGEKSALFDSALADRMLRILLASGVTTVRNPGSWVATTREQVQLRDKMRTPDALWPQIVTAGRILSDPRISEAELQAEIADQADAGVDFIKVYSAMPTNLVATAIRAAHARQLPVAGHLQQTPWRAAAESGIDFIEHGASWSASDLPQRQRAAYDTMRGMQARISWLELVDVDDSTMNATIDALVRHRVAVTPTLVAFQSKFWGYDPAYHADPANGPLPELVDDWRVLGTFTDDWSADDFLRARRAWPRLLRLTKRLHDAGVLVTAGADVGSPWVTPGASFHRELQLLSDAGIPPLQILRIATRNGAAALNRLDSLGTVTIGKRADLVLLRRDPSTDVGALREIEYVIRGGNAIRPASLAPPERERLQEGDIRTDDGAVLHFYVDGGGARDTLLIPLGVILEPELRALAARHTVIFYDPRGRGLSSGLRSEDYVSRRTTAFSRDLADLEAVRRHFKISKPTLVGWSFYSLLAARYAIEHPATVGRVILVSPLAPRRDPYAGQMDTRYQTRLDVQFRRSLDSVRINRRTTSDSINYCRNHLALYVPANMANQGRGLTLHADPCLLRNEWPEQSALASGASYESLGEFDWRPALETLPMPLLIVYGTEDASPSEGVREWLAAPNSQLVTLPRAAHWPFLEASSRFNSAVESFLANNR